MKNYLKKYREAVVKAIKDHHARGLPVYQSKDGYIVAIYPDGQIKKLQPSPILQKLYGHKPSSAVKLNG